jgi:hypothetical protein
LVVVGADRRRCNFADCVHERRKEMIAHGLGQTIAPTPLMPGSAASGPMSGEAQASTGHIPAMSLQPCPVDPTTGFCAQPSISPIPAMPTTLHIPAMSLQPCPVDPTTGFCAQPSISPIPAMPTTLASVPSWVWLALIGAGLIVVIGLAGGTK